MSSYTDPMTPGHPSSCELAIAAAANLGDGERPRTEAGTVFHQGRWRRFGQFLTTGAAAFSSSDLVINLR
jgi:hypothetical protein